jgi:hypothetical protein
MSLMSLEATKAAVSMGKAVVALLCCFLTSATHISASYWLATNGRPSKKAYTISTLVIFAYLRRCMSYHHVDNITKWRDMIFLYLSMLAT